MAPILPVAGGSAVIGVSQPPGPVAHHVPVMGKCVRSIKPDSESFIRFLD
jgi:hypothetical protein